MRARVNGIDLGQHQFCLVEASDEQEMSNGEAARVRGVQEIAALFQRCSRRLKRVSHRSQVT